MSRKVAQPGTALPQQKTEACPQLRFLLIVIVTINISLRISASGYMVQRTDKLNS